MRQKSNDKGQHRKSQQRPCACSRAHMLKQQPTQKAATCDRRIPYCHEYRLREIGRIAGLFCESGNPRNTRRTRCTCLLDVSLPHHGQARSLAFVYGRRVRSHGTSQERRYQHACATEPSRRKRPRSRLRARHCSGVADQSRRPDQRARTVSAGSNQDQHHVADEPASFAETKCFRRVRRLRASPLP